VELQVNPLTAGGIYINGSRQATNKYITSLVVGSCVELISLGNGDWASFGTAGTWTVQT
jgi:hypothetical protein